MDVCLSLGFTLEDLKQELSVVVDGEGRSSFDDKLAIAGQQVHSIDLGDDSVERSLFLLLGFFFN